MDSDPGDFGPCSLAQSVARPFLNYFSGYKPLIQGRCLWEEDLESFTVSAKLVTTIPLPFTLSLILFPRTARMREQSGDLGKRIG